MRFQSMVSERAFMIALAALFLLNLADAATTYYALSNGISHEYNPTMAYFINEFGLAETMFFKVLVVASISFLIYSSMIEYRRRYNTCDSKKKRLSLFANNLWFFAVVYSCVLFSVVVAGNTAVILGYTR